MGWYRKGNRRYYQRSLRVGGEVKTFHLGPEWYVLGSGIADDIEAEESREREERREERERLRAEAALRRAEGDAEDAPLDAMFAVVEAVARAALRAAGYHQHSRGAWRKRRTMSDAIPATAADIAPAAPTPREGYEIVARVRAGDQTAIPALRALLEEHPRLCGQLLRPAADVVACSAEEAFLGAAGGDALTREVLRHDLRRTADELAGPAAGPLVRLLARRTALCWNAVGVAEHAAGDAAQRRLDRAHRRFLSAARTLATVQRLARRDPLIAVNLAMPTAPPADDLPVSHREWAARDHVLS